MDSVKSAQFAALASHCFLAVLYLNPLHPGPPHPPHVPQFIDASWFISAASRFVLASASSKLCAFSPSESRSCSVEWRTEASSSRMHMQPGSVDTGSAPDTNPSAG